MIAWVEATALWNQSLNYCFDCRNQHKLEDEQFKNGSMPLCDKTEGMKCERIRSWQKADGTVMHTPIDLMPENYKAVSIYEKIAAVSDRKEYHTTINKKNFYVTINSLSVLEMILSLYSNEMSVDEIEDLIDKITLIHTIKTNNALVV